MAIKVLHTEWSDGWGGQEIRIVNEMIAMREKGIELFLACREDATIKEKAQEAGFKVFTLPFRGNTDIKTLYGLTRIIKKHNIDIVNTHSGKDTWVGGLAAKLTGVKFIRTRHLSNPINSSRTNFINELADFIFTTGESVRNDMIEHNRIDPEKILSVPTGIDATLFDPARYDRLEARKKFGFEEDEIVIGIVAVLRQFKRHDLFLEAAKSLLEESRGKKLKFAIAGDGPQKERIETLAQELNITDNVVMLGHLDNVPEFLRAIDVFVLSSDSKEGVPQSVIQALLMNKKVVATNAGSTADLHNDENFVLIPVNNKEAIVKGIQLQIEAEEKNTRAYMLENFTTQTMAKTLERVYKELLYENAESCQ